MLPLSKPGVARFVSLVLVVSGFCAAVARDGRACGNVTVLRTEERVKLLVDAEDRLRRGMPRLAAWWAAAARGQTPAMATANPSLHARAVRLLAIASIRTDGDLELWSVRLLNHTPALREKNGRWAAQTLKDLAAEAPEDATLQTYLGEALARLPEQRADAHQKLSALAAADRMVSPQGYAALAGLHAEAAAAPSAWFLSSRWGVHRALAEDAWRRCENMSAEPATCRPTRRATAMRRVRGAGGAT